MDERQFNAGERVVKNKGDYRFEGQIMAIFYKRDGQKLRVVVENDDGILHIFNQNQLEHADG